MTEAQRRLRLWIEQGNKPCAHPELDREYYLGAQGVLVCTTCGTLFVSRAEAEQDRQQQPERLARKETQKMNGIMLRYERKANDGNDGHRAMGMQAAVDEGEDPEVVAERMRAFVHRQLHLDEEQEKAGAWTLTEEDPPPEEAQAATWQSHDQDALETVEDATAAALGRAWCDAPVTARGPPGTCPYTADIARQPQLAKCT